jgi:hypothetical protein
MCEWIEKDEGNFVIKRQPTLMEKSMYDGSYDETVCEVTGMGWMVEVQLLAGTYFSFLSPHSDVL